MNIQWWNAFLDEEGVEKAPFNERLYKYLVSQGHTGQLNDSLFAFLRSQGHTGNVQDMIRKAFLAGISTEFDVSTLFASGEMGAWYDPSDLSTLYQDFDLLEPVTTDGQVVSAMLDKSGNGRHVYANFMDPSTNPTYKTDGTLHWLEFNGSNSLSTSGTINMAGTDKMSVFASLHKTSNDSVGILAEFSPTFATNAGSFIVAAPTKLANLLKLATGSPDRLVEQSPEWFFLDQFALHPAEGEL
jgi:hypothetical protein